MLKVSGAFHCTLMDGARDALKQALANVTVSCKHEGWGVGVGGCGVQCNRSDD